MAAGKAETVATLSWRQALAWRMRRHRLVERAPAGEMLDVAGQICGLHAQVMSSAELTLWARVDGMTPDAVQDALWRERSLVKLWAMRGTLHLLPSTEIGMWLAALGTYEHYLKPVWLRAFGITRKELERLITTIGKALDSELLTREELGAEVARLSRSKTIAERIQGSWGAYLKPASFRGLLCFAPGEGQRVRFTTPANWLPGGVPEVDPDEALREVTRRYLGAFAPATREDLGRWWAVSPAQARRMLEGLGDEAVEVDVDGGPCWMLAEHVTEAAGARKPPNIARLLPGFDQWAIGASRTAPAQLDPGHKARVYRPQGWISPVLLVNGRMDGVWRHERKGARLIVEIEPFGKLPAWARKQAGAEAGRLAEHLGADLEVTWSD
ncbi:MAG TPA: winged helix DNA-binding domain-containing protein [Thermoleophilaceae bacterium]|nr:winged helix DNA-binding domain-containing protein [Thermoleophilaceae bacterium]